MQDSRISPLPASDWDNSLSHILAARQDKPLNIHALMANHPQLLAAWWNLRNHVVHGGDLGQRKAELIILRVALHMKSWYEWASHVVRALNSGVTMEELDRIFLGADAAEWQPDEAVLIKAVDELIAEHAIKADTLEALTRYFSFRQIMDLITIQGMYVTLGGLINSLGLELDESVSGQLPAGINQAQFRKRCSCSG